MKRLITAAIIATITLMPLSAAAAVARTNANSAAISRIQGLANNEITRRITTLNGLLTIINAATHLSAADKTSLTTQINTELANLPALKTKIDADTDLATLRTDVQSIYTEFRVYALLVPKVHLVRVADRLTDATAKLTVYADLLQAKIDAARASGKDVTAETATMADMRSQIATSNSDANSVDSTLVPLTPDQYNASPTIISNLRVTLNAGRQATAKALQDGSSVRNGLKSLGVI